MTLQSKSKKISLENGKYIVGGEPIAAGGYGCVFKPALKCRTSPNRTSGVSKLLLSRHALEEYNEIQQIIPIIRTIPNHDKYFIADGIEMCDPDVLTSSDLNKFDKKCKNLTKNNIYSRTINRELDKLKILNIVDGGDDISSFIKNKGRNLTPIAFNKLNESLIKLLENAILPMNERGLYHFDIKASNVLIDSSFDTRIIDWGLAKIQHGDEIPRISRPLQYNLPLPVIVFSDRFKQPIKEILDSRIGRSIDSFQEERNPTLREQYVRVLENACYGKFDFLVQSGHYALISEGLLENKTNLNRLFEKMVARIILQYKIVGETEIDTTRYFNDIFKHNADVWGFIMIYYTIYEHGLSGLSEDGRERISNLLREIFDENGLSINSAVTRINITNLIENLEKLGQIYSSHYINSSSSLTISSSPLQMQPVAEYVKSKTSTRKRKHSPIYVKSRTTTSSKRRKAISIKSSREMSLGNRKRCPRGYKLNPITRRCKRK